MAQAQTGTMASTLVATAREEKARRITPFDVIVYLLLIFFALIALGPFIFSFLSSFKTLEHVLDFPPSLIPNPWTWANYQVILSNSLFLRWLLNSAIFAAATVVLNALFSAMAGYALSRLRFPGRDTIFLLTLAVMMVPLPIIVLPKFLIAYNMHITNSMLGLILPYMVQPISVFLMVQNLKSLPRELEEAAMIDGASRWRIFFQIVLPLVKPALTAVAILSFMGSWNEFFWSLLTLNSQDQLTLPIGLSFFKGAHYTEYNLLLAGSMFNTIPVLIVFFIFQRYFIEGIASAGLKG
ncbi:MAG: carbohydrate ABC transporter permease [Ktedonobacteraceae bacterium]|nr:carbohydrate ABC transporter permease [Ktedonobacteraceae bacterium]